jgi:hypothetical protein
MTFTDEQVNRLRDALRYDSNPVSVRFKKADGTERVMSATANLSLIPTDKHPKGVRANTPDVMKVYDTEAQGWRSFRVDSLIEVTY